MVMVNTSGNAIFILVRLQSTQVLTPLPRDDDEAYATDFVQLPINYRYILEQNPFKII